MGFIVSKDTIESLMGPAIRTQATTPSISPRQSRIRAAGLRSASDVNLPLSTDAPRSQSTAETKSDSPSRISFTRRSSLPNLNLAHPQAQLSYPQQLSNSLDPASLHSQPRRRRSRQSMYNSSIDLSSKHSLAPVIENDISPAEEKTQAQSFNLSHPVYGLFPTQSIVKLSDQDESCPEDDSSSEKTKSLEVDASFTFEKSAHLVELEASSLAKGLQFLNHGLSNVPLASMSSPELTCSSSLSSSAEDDTASRSSISSSSSIDDLTEVSDLSIKSSRDKEITSQYYAAYLAKEAARKAKVSSATSDKANKLLGPESPKLSTTKMFEFSPAPAHHGSDQTYLSRHNTATDVVPSRKAKLSAFGVLTSKSWTRKNRSSTALS